LLSESYLCIIVYNASVRASHRCGLWIAFRIVSLHYRLQQILQIMKTQMVVNCFQNRIFALSFTTPPCTPGWKSPLWIAFRIVSLHYRLQRIVRASFAITCCELLSESYLCIIVYNL